MIRFIHIGDQAYEYYDQFAFYDTVRDKFMEINEQHIFNSLFDIRYCMNVDKNIDKQMKERLLNLIPDSYKKHHG